MSLYVDHRELMKATRKVIGKRIKDDLIWPTWEGGMSGLEGWAVGC